MSETTVNLKHAIGNDDYNECRENGKLVSVTLSADKAARVNARITELEAQLAEMQRHNALLRDVVKEFSERLEHYDECPLCQRSEGLHWIECELKAAIDGGALEVGE